MYRPKYTEIVDTAPLVLDTPFLAADAIGSPYLGGAMSMTKKDCPNFAAVGFSLPNMHSLAASYAHAFGVSVPFDLEERNFYHWSMNGSLNVIGAPVQAQPFVGFVITGNTSIVPMAMLSGAGRANGNDLYWSGSGAFRMLDIANAITPGVTGLFFGVGIINRGAVSSVGRGLLSFTVSHFDEPDFVRQVIT